MQYGIVIGVHTDSGKEPPVDVVKGHLAHQLWQRQFSFQVEGVARKDVLTFGALYIVRPVTAYANGYRELPWITYKQSFQK
jgi:hypothetical protein